MKTILSVEGMMCSHCTGAVEKALRAVPGVQDVHVDLAAKTAVVEAGTPVSGEVLKKAVTDAGYQVVAIR